MPEATPSRARPSPSDVIGQMAGEYRLGRLLGEGGFGAVYEAEHPLLKRRAAVKVLHRAGELESEAVQRFVGEAQVVNQIKSRHILDVFSFGTLADGRYFYVMDFLEGEPLDGYLKRQAHVEVDTAIQILQPIADALDSAHRAGIIHRDLKPQNIFLARDTSDQVVPKLLDFGMAKLIASSPARTVSGTPIGTPLYMSPEQARGDKVDARCDIYAFGVVCYEMLVGQVPFDAEATVTVLMAHLIQAPPRPSEVCKTLPAELDAPLLAMLEKEPAGRPSTAGEAITALRAAAERAGIAISSAPPTIQPRTAADSHRQSAALAMQTTARASHISIASGRDTEPRPASRQLWLVGAAMLMLGAGLTLWLSRRPSPTAPVTEPSASALNAATSTVPTATAPPSFASSAPSASDIPAANDSPTASSAPRAASDATKKPSALEAASKKRHGAPAGSAIPRDLESPFGP